VARFRRPGGPNRFPRPTRGTTPVQPLYATAAADMGGLTGYATSDDGALYFGNDTYFGAGVYFDGPELGSTFLADTLSPYARLAVEVAWGADPAGDPTLWTWTDVTADVRQDTGIDIKVGKSDEASKPQPATLRLTFDNRLGAYNRGPNSPNHPYVRRGVPVRVSVNLGENLDAAAVPGRAPGAYPSRALVAPQRTFRPRFLGFADGFTPKWDLTGTDATAELEASGILRRLGQGAAPLPSPAKRAIQRLPSLLAYWPMEDDKFSTVPEAGMPGVSAMGVVGGPPIFAAQGQKAVQFSDPVLQVHDATLVGLVPNYVETGQMQLRFMASIVDEGTYTDASADLVSFTTTGTVSRWAISVGQNVSLGVLTLSGRTSTGSSDTVSIPIASYIVDRPTMIGVDMEQVGADFTVRFSYYYPGGATSFYLSSDVSAQTFGKISRVVVHGNPAARGALDKAYVGHLFCRSVANFDSFSTTVGINAGERPTTRLQRLCDENSIPFDMYGEPGNMRMGQQTGRKLLDLLQECEEVEQGVLVDGITQGLTFFCYTYRYNLDPALTLDVARGQVAKELTPADDDQQTRNKWEVKRDGGGTTTVVDTDSQMGTGVIGIYDSSTSINTNSDDVLGDYAGWLVHLGTFDGYRWPQISFDLAKNPELAEAWVNVLPTDHIAVTNARTRRTQLPDDTLDLALTGYRETISRFRWNVTANCTPQLPWRVARYGDTSADTDPLVLRTETDGSTLPAGGAEGATSLTVYTPEGPLWTTTAEDLPITFNIGGFPVVCTAIVDATATTQTFTVAALTVTIQAGAAVALWRPPVPGL
jgi:hypothetical protein